MILNIYAFYDKKSQELTNPTFMKNDDLIRREIKKMFQEKVQNIPFIDYAEDFSLYKIGEFDTNALVTKKDSCVRILDVLDVKKEILDGNNNNKK